MLVKPTRDRRYERHQATKAEIVDAAWDLCRTEGLAGLTLRQLASRVGMQAASLYSYFDSKHAIYDAMFAEGVEAFVAGQREIVLSGDLLTDLKRYLHYFLDFCTSDEVRYQLLFQRTIPGFEPTREAFAVSQKNLQQFAEWLASVGLGGQATLDLFTALASGLANQQISNDPGGDRWLRLGDRAVEMFFDHVQGGRKKTTVSKGRRAE